MQAELIQPRRWTRAEYERLIADGYFQPGEHVELLDGEILTMTPQLSGHATSVHKSLLAIMTAFGPGFFVRSQSPLAITPDSEPEPDLAVVPGCADDYARQHPTTALLIVEVAETSLKLDRQKKGSLYARAGITDYWIVNLNERVLEVYRDPVETAQGWGYRLVQRLTDAETVTPLAKPDAVIAVAALLPKA